MSSELFSEFMASEGNYYYWQFVEKVVKMQSRFNDKEGTQELNHKYVIETAAKVLGVPEDSPKIRLLKFALSIHAYSPRLEMFQQVWSAV